MNDSFEDVKEEVKAGEAAEKTEKAEETVGTAEKAVEKVAEETVEATEESVGAAEKVNEKPDEKAGAGIHATHRSKPESKTRTKSSEKKGSHRVKKSDGKSARKVSLSSARQNRAWLIVSAVLLVLGLAWVVTYCLTRVYPIAGIGLWNVYIPSVIALLGFVGVLSWK